jgi:hypothetical protein
MLNKPPLAYDAFPPSCVSSDVKFVERQRLMLNGIIAAFQSFFFPARRTAPVSWVYVEYAVSVWFLGIPAILFLRLRPSVRFFMLKQKRRANALSHS